MNITDLLYQKKPLIIAGPCAVENKKQIHTIAKELSSLGIKFLRGGNFKPRTKHTSFQGLGELGMNYMKEAAEKFEMFVVSEMLTEREMNNCYDLVDIVQIGSRNMMSYGLLKEIGCQTSQDKKPVLLKRGMQATIPEMISASEYISKEGNKNILFCLRGIRTFEQTDSKFRNTPDLASILELKERKLFTLYDPSHAAGNKKYVIPIAKAALNLDADGLLIEVHNNPLKALSDRKQALNLQKFAKFLKEIEYKK